MKQCCPILEVTIITERMVSWQDHLKEKVVYHFFYIFFLSVLFSPLSILLYTVSLSFPLQLLAGESCCSSLILSVLLHKKGMLKGGVNPSVGGCSHKASWNVESQRLGWCSSCNLPCMVQCCFPNFPTLIICDSATFCRMTIWGAVTSRLQVAWQEMACGMLEKCFIKLCKCWQMCAAAELHRRASCC